MSTLVITGSARQASLTRALGAAIAAAAEDGVLAPRLTSLPYYDQDRDGAPPASVVRFRQQVADADLLVVVTPEYNGTVPGLLGNAIDWLSRPKGALAGKRVMAVAASPGARGGVRALTALRTVLANLGVELVGPGVLVPEVEARLAAGDLEDVIDQALGVQRRQAAAA